MPKGGKAMSGQIKSVEVTPSEAAVSVGGSYQFQAFVVYNDGTKLDVTQDASWYAYPNTVASIWQQGLANGLSVGQAQITAQYRAAKGAKDYFYYGNAILDVQ